MQLETLIMLIVLLVACLSGIIAIIVAIARGDLKKFIEAKMIEAEKQQLSGEEKLKYVLEAVNEKYKVVELFLNVKKFIEHIIDLSKQINAK